MHPNMECHSQSQNSRATFDSWSYKQKEVCSFLERGWISSAFHTLSSLAAAFAFDSCPQLPTISLSFFSQRHVSDFIYFSSFFSSSLLLFFSLSQSKSQTSAISSKRPAERTPNPSRSPNVKSAQSSRFAAADTCTLWPWKILTKLRNSPSRCHLVLPAKRSKWFLSNSSNNII